MTDNQNNDKNPEKTLGKSSYKNSKHKLKIKRQKLAEKKKVAGKNRQLKSKMKNLEKELTRISKESLTNKKIVDQKLSIEKKIDKLNLINGKLSEKFVKKDKNS